MSAIISDLCFPPFRKPREHLPCALRSSSHHTQQGRSARGIIPAPRNPELSEKNSHMQSFKCGQMDPCDDWILPGSAGPEVPGRMWCLVGSLAPGPVPLLTSLMRGCPGNQPMPDARETALGHRARVPTVSLEAVMTVERPPPAGM